MSTLFNLRILLSLLFLFRISAGLPFPIPSSPSSSQQGQGEPSASTTSYTPPTPSNYTTKQATKILRSSLRKWNKNEERWKKCMECKGTPDLQRADEIESNIKHHKQKIEEMVMKNNQHLDSRTTSENQKKRFTAAQDKAQDKLENFTHQSRERKYFRHQKTGQPSSHE